MEIEKKLNALGYQVSDVPDAAGNYINYVRRATCCLWAAIRDESMARAATKARLAMRSALTRLMKWPGIARSIIWQ